MRVQLVAPVRHTIIFLGIFTLLFLVGLQNASSSAPLAAAVKSHIPLYLGIISLQVALIFFIWRGVTARGRTLAELTTFPSREGEPSSPTRLRTSIFPRMTVELVLGLLFAAAMHYFLDAVRLRLGFIQDRTSALLPHGPGEAFLWIAVSVSAGIAEELAFRGYLQRQLMAFIGSRAAAALLQSLVFGLAHGYQGWKPILLTALFGLCATLLTLWRGNLYAAMVAHAATDIAGGLWR
jgi:membrane protease YdiL (CAAX protease family)